MYAKVNDRFFSASANSRNSSESATPAAVELAGKTLYLLEELPAGRVHSSLLKMVASQDTIRGRALYKGERDITLTGKLVINANSAPDLGEEGPVWDRAVYIPWDTRYVQDGEVVDEENYRLPSNNTKKETLVSMRDAFATVCLKELNKFLNAPGNRDLETGELKVSELPQPECVKELVAKEKEKGFPLKMFVNQYVKEIVHGTKPEVSVETLFSAYRGFLRVRNIRSAESMDDILEKFPRVGLVAGMDRHNEQCVKGYFLSSAGLALADRESIRIGGPDPFAIASESSMKRTHNNDQVDERPSKKPAMGTVQCQSCFAGSPFHSNWRCSFCQSSKHF
jgi:hypothetical protein